MRMCEQMRRGQERVIQNKAVVVISVVEEPARGDLLEVGQASDGMDPAFGLAQRGQQQRGEDRENGNDDQQFNQRKGATNQVGRRDRMTIHGNFKRGLHDIRPASSTPSRERVIVRRAHWCESLASNH